MAELNESQFIGLKPGFLSGLPSFRRDVMEKMAKKPVDISGIPDPTLLAMYKGGFYSHPAFGEMPHFDRVEAVRQELTGRNVLNELANKEVGKEDPFQQEGRAARK